MSQGKSIIGSTILVTTITFVIKFMGLLKQSILAAYCGATDETDAFFIGSGVIFAMSTMVFSAISISLLAIHTNRLIHNGREKANLLINSTLRFFLPISALITVVFFFCSSWIAKFLAPAYEGEQLQLLARYIKLMSPVFVLSCYYLTINVILETDKEFVPGRMYGFFQNGLLIVAAVLLFKPMGMEALILAFVLSCLAECVLVTVYAGKRLRIIWGAFIPCNKDVLSLLRLSVPLIMGNALYEINDIVDKQISSYLGTGNASYLTYGSTINEIVTGVVVSSISVVLFSHFATWIAEGKIHKVQEGLNRSIEVLAIIIFPIMALCLFASEDIIRILYARGSFGCYEVGMTKMVVIGYAIGFLFSSVRTNMVKVFYAFQDTQRPLINGAISIAINIICSIVLSKFIGIGGVALATSIAMMVSTMLLMKQIKCHIPSYSILHSAPEYVKGIIGFIVCSSVLVAITYLPCIINIFIKSLVCIVSYIATLLIIKSKVAVSAVQLLSTKN